MCERERERETYCERGEAGADHEPRAARRVVEEALGARVHLQLLDAWSGVRVYSCVVWGQGVHAWFGVRGLRVGVWAWHSPAPSATPRAALLFVVRGYASPFYRYLSSMFENRCCNKRTFLI